MSDIVERLRASVTQCRAVDRSQLLEEAADEIVKIRQEVADMRGGLTNAECVAMRFAIAVAQNAGYSYVATLRGLFERLK